MGIEFLKPTTKLIGSIASDMRQADVDEIWSSNHYSPMQALVTGLKASDLSVVISVNNDPCVMIGLVVGDILTGSGTPWLLGTNKSLKYKRHFIDKVPVIINEMLVVCPILYNYVHVNNKISIRWLKRIGFSFCDPAPYGYENELFHKFCIEKV